MIVVCEGGNQSGKTWLACVDAVAYALCEHPYRAWPKDGHAPSIWYTTESYELFGQQPWVHIRDLLLYPGESVLKLPTVNIKHILWESKPNSPKVITLNNGADITVKGYSQGLGQFMSKTLDHCVIDEECPNEVWNELNARLFASKDPRIVVAATPIRAMKWLEDLRKSAFDGDPGVKHFRLRTLDNPGMNESSVKAWLSRCSNVEERRLRLEGYPYVAEGLIYPDGLFMEDKHVIEPFEIPREWTKYRCVDPGIRNCAALWIAVSPPSINTVVVYRDYLGKDRTIAQNAEAIMSHERRGEHCHRSWIDPAAVSRDAETGTQVIDLWRYRGWRGAIAPDNRVVSGIERVKDLLVEVGGPNKDRPRFRVFKSCQEFLRERRNYRLPKEKTSGDEQSKAVVKRDDHVMDCWRYIVAAGLDYAPYQAPPVPCPDKHANPEGYAFWRARHPLPKSKL